MSITCRNLLERLERDEAEVRFVCVDTARPEVLVKQLGAARSVDPRLPARRPPAPAERPPERRRARRRTAGAGRRRCRRAQRLHRQDPAAGSRLVGLDAGVDGRLVAERAPPQRRRNDPSSHQCDRMSEGQTDRLTDGQRF